MKGFASGRERDEMGKMHERGYDGSDWIVTEWWKCTKERINTNR